MEHEYNRKCPTKMCSITHDVTVKKTKKALNIWIEDKISKKSPSQSRYEDWFEKLKIWCNLHKVQLVGKSASADHLAVTRNSNF